MKKLLYLGVTKMCHLGFVEERDLAACKLPIVQLRALLAAFKGLWYCAPFSYRPYAPHATFVTPSTQCMCSPVPKSVWRVYPCVPRPPTFTRALSALLASSTVIYAHALSFLYALLRHAALIRHKSCLAMPSRGRIVT